MFMATLSMGLTMSGGPESYTLFWVFTIGFVVLFSIIQILVALLITKFFWKCTLKQAFLAHLIPIILYVLYMLLMFFGIFASVALPALMMEDIFRL